MASHYQRSNRDGDTLVRQPKSQRRSLCLTRGGLALCFVLFSAVLFPSGWRWQRVVVYGRTVREDETSFEPLTTRVALWEIPVQEEDQNWAGLRKLREDRAVGSLWWDESAEQYFIAKLEKTQFTSNCSNTHWIAHYEWIAGLLSTVHMFFLPLFIAMVRGHTLVPISDSTMHHAFDGCGPKLSHLNMQCFFNVTTCNPADDISRLSHVLSTREEQRKTWEEVLMEEDDFFPEGGVTVMKAWKMPAWTTEVCVTSSSFSSYLEAFTYHKLALWNELGQHGKIGVVTSSTKKCPGNEKDSRTLRIDMVITSLMSAWMLNRMANRVKVVADNIMSRYTNELGQPLWKSPVLAIHIRQTDKKGEDLYFFEHGVYRPVENYVTRMKQLEAEYGFKWPSIFLISDSGMAIESMTHVLNGNDSTAPQQDRRFIMYDWDSDDHMMEKFGNHENVPEALKHDMQTHFLATLYILQKIADHAIVTHSSNIGRFIAESLAAKNRMAFVDREGPFVTSLDDAWVWHSDYIRRSDALDTKN